MSQYLVPQYAAPWLVWVISALIIITCLIGLFYDLRWRIIPNWLTYGALFTGLLFNGVLAGSSGLISAIFGAVIASIFFIPLFFMGGFGGGDVKMMAALGALGGARLGANILLLTAFAGGILGLLQITCKGSWLTSCKRLGLLFRFKLKELEAAPENEQLSMPYGIAMTIGGLGTMVLQFTNMLLL